jgi:ABC-2 type transport system ATP-binding protein
VLRGVDLDVAAGEIVGLLGANGAGKSTLVRALAGQVRAEGMIAVGGTDVARTPQARQRIGLVPQELGLHPHLTPAETLEVFGRLLGLRGALLAERTSWALAAAALEGVRDRRVAVLSGGYRRRLNLAVALLDRPALVVLDEPTVGVDPPARLVMDRLLDTLRQLGAGILLITHDLEQAEALCDRVAFLRAGRLDPVGPPSVLVHTLTGGRRRLALRLRAAPDAAQSDLLLAHGLRPEQDGRSWRGAIAEASALPPLLKAWHDAGIGLREVAMREADLALLFDELIRPEAAP